MGLDMYLYKKTYVKNWEFTEPDDVHEVRVTRGGKPVPETTINPARVAYVVEDAGYWRKANAIHRWFVEHVQDGDDDCGSYYVSREQLRELLTLVETVLAHPDLAERLLPTQEGFFFGGTAYDEYYVEDLKETKRILTEAVADEQAEFEYTSSW